MVRNFYINKYLFTSKYALKILKLLYCEVASKCLQVILFQKPKSLKFQTPYIYIYIYLYIAWFYPRCVYYVKRVITQLKCTDISALFFFGSQFYAVYLNSKTNPLTEKQDSINCEPTRRVIKTMFLTLFASMQIHSWARKIPLQLMQ